MPILTPEQREGIMKGRSAIICGCLLCLAGIGLGLYVGAWVCFVGGIKQIVFAVQQHPIPPTMVAVGVLKILFTGFCGWISAAVLFVPGLLLIKKA